MDLPRFWRAHPAAAIALSGGADSAYLLYSAVQAGAAVKAYFVQTEFQPAFERDDAQRLAAQLGVPLQVLPLEALADPQIAVNPPDRCYHCKRRLLSAILDRARADGYALLADGTNASDTAGDRPGMRALGELSVVSPLRLCGLDKQDVRRRAREAGLFTWDKPAYACLATRFPAGMPLAAEELRKIDEAEAYLRELGFSDLRLRRTPGGVRLQLPAAQLPAAAAQAAAISARLTPVFGEAVLDLAPRPAGEPPDAALVQDRVAELRCNLDDMTGEDIAFAVERLLEAGALDAWTAPIYMKKGRPAVLLTCLCPAAEARRFTDLLLRHTATLGVRRSDCGRLSLPRTVERRGPVRVKVSQGGGIRREKPEHDDLAALAQAHGLSLEELRQQLGF